METTIYGVYRDFQDPFLHSELTKGQPMPHKKITSVAKELAESR